MSSASHCGGQTRERDERLKPLIKSKSESNVIRRDDVLNVCWSSALCRPESVLCHSPLKD